MAFDINKSATVEQYLRRISGKEKELEIAVVDHSYSRAWNAHPDSNHARPARMLFMKGLHTTSSPLNRYDQNIEIDIETHEEPVTSPFDNPKSHHLMNECDRYLKYNPLLDEPEDKEENISTAGWTTEQLQLYNQVMKVLQLGRLARLSYVGTKNEPVKRRLSVDKTCRRLKNIFGSIFWDRRLLYWLHQTLTENVNTSTLSIYVDAMQSLKARVPNFVDSMFVQQSTRPGFIDPLNQSKKPWEPTLQLLSHHKPRKLPGNPILVVTRSAPGQQLTGNHSQRLRFWHNHLSALGKVVNVPVYSGGDPNSITTEECLDQIIASVRNKVIELRNHYPTRPIILIGWTIGALIATHVALQEQVSAIICLGFPLCGVNGSRGDLDDPLLENKVPTLFIVGQNSSMCSSDDIEDFRARMRADTGLVVVGGANDVLKVSQMKKKIEGITQSIVDRCLVDEITDFLLLVMNVQLPPLPTPAPAREVILPPPVAVAPEMIEPTPEIDGSKRRRRKPKEYSPELSPVRKRPKHTPSKQHVTSHKARLSPSSSETSSSGSFNHVKSHSSRAASKKSERKVGRPPASPWRKRLKIKPIINPADLVRKPPEKPIPDPVPADIPQQKPVSKPFPIKIMEQKNFPVDVEKAFGSDCSFLPRPLTPPEPEDTVSAEETESAISELEALEKAAEISPVATTTTTAAPNPVTPSGPTFLIAKGSFSPIASKPVTSPTVVLATTTVSTPAKPMITFPMLTTAAKVINADTKPTISVASASGIRAVFPQAKILTSSAIQNLRIAGNKTLVSTPQTTLGSPAKTQSIVLTVPSTGSPTTYLVSRPDGQMAKVIQFQKVPQKGLPTLLAKPPSLSALVTSSSPAAAEPASEHQSCNLSLLSDVAGMTEPMPQKSAVNTPPATLVKLASPSPSQPTNIIKCLKVIKPMVPPASTTPARLETQEEMVEKQLAIQAMNKSIGIDSPGIPARGETGYSICYAKPDGSFISHAVPKPIYSNYLPIQRGRGRGRGNRGSIFPVTGFKSF